MGEIVWHCDVEIHCVPEDNWILVSELILIVDLRQ